MYFTLEKSIKAAVQRFVFDELKNEDLKRLRKNRSREVFKEIKNKLMKDDVSRSNNESLSKVDLNKEERSLMKLS